MKVKVVCSSDLSDEHIAAWKRIQGANSCFASPCFRPEFTLSVAQLRDDVEVGIIEDGGRYGFFPFHRRGTVGKPVGLRLSDFQAVIVDPAMDWDAIRLIHDCGLRSWRFDHLIASQVPLQPYQWVTQPSPYVDLSEGFDAYLGRQRSAGSSSILQILRKSRKIQREVGPLRFEFNSSCHDDFQKLLTWKSHQRTATRSFDILRFNWARRCLEAIRTADTEGFGGILSALYVGNDLIAAHLGMRSRGVLHSWFPAFNPAYARYSPGDAPLSRDIPDCSVLGSLAHRLRKRVRSIQGPLEVVFHFCRARSGP